jgi:hypothetical protein
MLEGGCNEEGVVCEVGSFAKEERGEGLKIVTKIVYRFKG